MYCLISDIAEVQITKWKYRRNQIDPLHLHYMYTTHLLTQISLFQTPTRSLSRARTLSHLLTCQSPL